MLNRISIYECEKHLYPQASDEFRPDKLYPEYKLGKISKTRNYVYDGVRESFILLELDKEHIGTANWNPLGTYVKPGDNVLIKPNLVMDYNQNKVYGTDCLYTQPGLVAAVIDYVLLALKGRGKIIIGDAPMQECNFQNLIESSGYTTLIKYYKSIGIDIELVDFRELSSVVKNGIHHAKVNEQAKGKIINLGENSEFYGNKFEEKIRITNYDPRILPTHHRDRVQEYYISDYILNADVIINMPKPKTHRKAGVTISLKNFVGANVRKEFLPHHTMGAVSENGDEYLDRSIIHSFQSKLLDKRNIYASEKKYRKAQAVQFIARITYILMKFGKKQYTEGSWYGNHTISRTICDINKIVYYADKNGIMQDSRQRKIFVIADMVISGEKEGPIAPSPKDVGIIAMGDDQLYFDEFVSALMGFDSEIIPTLKCVKEYMGKYRFSNFDDGIKMVSNIKKYHLKKHNEIAYKDSFQFVPTDGWKNHIEKMH